jgi:hypothetical protein
MSNAYSKIYLHIQMTDIFGLCCKFSYIIYFTFCRMNNQSVARGMKQFLEIVTIGMVVRIVEITGNAKWMKKSLS